MSPQEFKAARNKLEWSQQRLADEALVSQSGIHNFESGMLRKSNIAMRAKQVMDRALGNR